MTLTNEYGLMVIYWCTWLVHIWVSLIYLMMYYWKHMLISWCMHFSCGLGYILVHMVGELMRWSCCTSLLIYSWCMIGTFLVHWKRHLLAVWLAHVLWRIWHTYMGFIILWYWCMVMYMFGTLIDDICLMILHHWYYLISTTIGICLRYLIVALGSWWRHITSDMIHCLACW